MITDKDIEKLKTVFATKDDLKSFASKADLQSFATKADLRFYATKDDLKNGLSETTKVLVELIGDAADQVMKSIRDEFKLYREESIAIKKMVYSHELRLDKIENKILDF